MTKQECAIIMAHTGVCMLTGDNRRCFYEYVDQIMGRQLFTHEHAIYADEIKANAKHDFIMLCRTAKEDKE